jgi:hypothetical protein
MSSFGRSRRCTHIKVTGHRCGSPALHGEDFCYFHAYIIKRVSNCIDNAISPIALIESEEAIQVSLMNIIDGILKGTIELKRAQLILRAISIAERNSRRTRIGYNTSDMVRRVPEQTAQPVAAAPGTDLSHSQNDLCHSEPASAGEESARPRRHSTADAHPLTDRELNEQRAIHDLECSLENALRGNLADCKTVFEAAGLLDADGHL